MSRSFTLTTSRSEPKNSDSNCAPWHRRLKPKPLAFDVNSSTDRLLAENTEIATTATTVAEIVVATEKIAREESINATTDLVMTGPRVIDREEIDPIRIDHPFAATTTGPRTEATTTARKAIVPPIEATTAETDHLTEAEIVPKATDLLIEEIAIDHPTAETTVAVIVLPTEVGAAGIDPAAVADAQAAAALDPAAADDQVAAVVSGQVAAVVEDLHSADQAATDHLEETKPKPIKKARTTKPKQI